MSESQVEKIRSMTNKQVIEAITALEQQVAELTTKVAELSAPKTKTEGKEMTDADAERILNGDLKDKKHKEAAEALGLTYGQIYSCRLEFTFKPIHKKLKEAGWKNTWVK